MATIQIICIHTTDHRYAPLAWTDREISDKEVRRLTKRFKTDIDFLKGVVLPWNRLYNSLDETKRLPYI